MIEAATILTVMMEMIKTAAVMETAMTWAVTMEIVKTPRVMMEMAKTAAVMEAAKTPTWTMEMAKTLAVMEAAKTLTWMMEMAKTAMETTKTLTWMTKMANTAAVMEVAETPTWTREMVKIVAVMEAVKTPTLMTKVVKKAAVMEAAKTTAWTTNMVNIAAVMEVAMTHSDDGGGDGEDGEGSSSDSGDDSHSDDGDGEDRSSDGGGDNSDSDDGDGEDSSSDGGNSDNLLCQIRVHFVDMFGRPLRPVDHCFPFLTELPGIENILLLNDCNGLLFGYIQESGKSLSRSYIESNPVTEQWVAVPVSHRKCTSLVFNPPASSHFHLVHIKKRDMIPVHIYSSKSGVWSPVRCDWGDLRIAPGLGSAYANGMLYVVLYEGDQIAVMDVEGNTRKIIPVPFQEGGEFQPCSLASPNSQGHLHLIYHADLGHGEILPEQQSNELFIWVLEDYDILI